MAHTIGKVEGATQDLVKVRRALLSVSDKTGLVELATFLHAQGVELLSTGGTAAKIRDAGVPVKDVSEYTGFPEMLDGRVKTLHPKVHGGLLGVRGNAAHEAAMAEHGIAPIDLVVLNLYAFEATVAKGADFETCIENIDIGGPSMLRSSAKNHKAVAICSSPSAYAALMAEMAANDGATTHALRRKLAREAFCASAAYDSAIAAWFAEQPDLDAGADGADGAAAAPATPPPTPASTAIVTSRAYRHEHTLKYGCNPHQKPARIHSRLGTNMPFRVRNGTPGYINLLDAVNAWQLVAEVRAALDMPAATSFKHVSPAGAAVGVPLPEDLVEAYEVQGKELTPLATAYIRARGADPMSSFGDFVAVSDVVDEATAMVLKIEVSDGIIAPGYEPAALAILAAKKKGKFIVLEADTSYTPPPTEYREVWGVGFEQKRNDRAFDRSNVADVVTGDKAALSEEAQRDLVLASIALKYTQSNSVAYAKDGQCVGIGAGQQSRVDCVKLAARKVGIWWMRQHPKVKALPFKAVADGGPKRQDRVNARVRYIEGDFTAEERVRWEALFTEVPAPLSDEDKASHMAALSDVALASDAFFPFRDSIDHASKVGVKYVAQPGGSVQDDSVIATCEEYGMSMAFTGFRLFHH